jgi:RNA polymerase sigma-70 factor (ECF subfamily)
MDPSANHHTAAGFETSLVASYPQLYSLALRLCRNPADAHDLVQDTVERGLRCRTSFRSGDAPDRWMCTILRRIFVDSYRSRQRRRAVLLALETRNGTSGCLPEAEEPPPSETFTAEDVRRALESLDPASRETFSLFAFGNLAQREIAQRLSISTRTVATRVFRTRGKLRQIFASTEHRASAA